MLNLDGNLVLLKKGPLVGELIIECCTCNIELSTCPRLHLSSQAKAQGSRQRHPDGSAGFVETRILSAS